MPETLVTHGLCGVCAKAARCLYLCKAGGPLLQCDEFELDRLPLSRASGQRPAPGGARLGVAAAEEDSEAYTGLCRDCENRADCTFPQPEGGVWRCEEYR